MEVREAAHLPNEFLHPGDSLVFIARTSGNEWMAEDLIRGLEDRLNVKIDDRLMQKALDEDWSLSRIATGVLALACHQQ